MIQLFCRKLNVLICAGDLWAGGLGKWDGKDGRERLI
jgi:hypothetical protein